MPVQSTTRPWFGATTEVVATPFVVVALSVVLALGVVLGQREIFSVDIGFHLETARWMLAHWDWPRTDAFSYTVSDRAYIDLQWLYQLGLWGAFRAGGTLALVLLNTGLTLVSCGFVVWRARRRVGRLSMLAAPVLLLFFLGDIWEIRPHVVSWVLLNVVLFLLEERRSGSSRKTIWLLPLVMLLWVNTHSLFVLGAAAIAAHLIDDLRRLRAADARLLAASVLAALACFVNPYGPRGALFPLEQLGFLQSGSVFKSGLVGIQEIQTVLQVNAYSARGELILVQPLLFMQLYLAAALAGLAALGRRRRLVDLLLFALFGYILWRAQKNFGYFVMATFPAAVEGLGVLAAAVSRRRAALAGRLALGAGVATVGACVAIAVQVLTGYWCAREASPHRLGHRFNAEVLPVRAAQFLNGTVPPGRLLNTWDDGAYLRFATGRPVFIYSHAEVIGEAFFAEYVAMKAPSELPRALEKWRFEIAVIPFNQVPSWFEFFNRRPDWRCVYADEAHAVFLERSFAPEVPELANPRKGVDFPIFSWAEVDAILDSAARRRPPGLLASLTRRHDRAQRELRWTAFHLLRQQPSAAVGHGLAGLRDATFPAPDILNNLVYAFMGVGDRRRALRCFEALPPRLRDQRLGARLREAASR